MEHQCPNCEYFKLEPRRTRWLRIGAICLVASLFVVTIPIALPLMLIAYVAALFTTGQRCSNCGWETGAPTRGKDASSHY